MITITATELRRHLGKYMRLGETQEIVVTKRGKEIFTIVPRKADLAARWESYFGILPADALTDSIDRD